MPADEAILKDKELYFRVLPLQNPFQDARTSYYHKNVGGYHAAKLRRYQEFIDHHLQPELQQFVTSLQNRQSADSTLQSLDAINMMNTKYIIYDLNQAPIRNPYQMGNAWLVENYKIVENADEEIEAMQDVDPAETAVIDKRFKNFVDGKQFSKDQAGSVKLTEYQPNYLKYIANTTSEQLTVFSEIYYEKGWKAYVNGEEVPHFRVNYVLRALVLPPGENTIEFKFEPASYYLGNKISLASSLLLILAIAGYMFTEIRKKKVVD